MGLMKIVQCPLCKMYVQFEFDEIEAFPDQNKYVLSCPFDQSQIRIRAGIYHYFLREQAPDDEKEKIAKGEEAKAAYEKYGNYRAAAKELGVTPQTVKNRIEAMVASVQN